MFAPLRGKVCREAQNYGGMLGRLWQSWINKPLTLTVTLLIMIGLIFILLRTYQVRNLGFDEKTLWDWLTLLILPLAVGLGIWWLDKVERSSDNERQRDRDREQRQTAFLTNMTHVLGQQIDDNQKLSETQLTHIRSHVLTTLPGLDGSRKAFVLRYLYEAKLIMRADTEPKSLGRVKLENADFSGLVFINGKLHSADLSGASFEGADFQGTELDNCSLSNANLKRVSFISSRLLKADLTGADLSGANVCGGANLSDATLERATLESLVWDPTTIVAGTLMDKSRPGGSLAYLDVLGQTGHEASTFFDEEALTEKIRHAEKTEAPR